MRGQAVARRQVVVIGLGLTLLAASEAGAQTRTPVMGSQVRVSLVLRTEPWRGELIALSSDSLWLLGRSVLFSAPLRDVQRVRVVRHKAGSALAFRWGLVGGLVTGLALTGACSSVDASGCPLVLPLTVLMWTAVSGLSALTMGPSSHKDFRRPRFGGLNAFARFPQGLPSNLDPRVLAPPQSGSTERKPLP